MPAGNWFTTVATDLFAGAFAAVLIIDAATPKKPIAQEEPVILTITYDGTGVDCRDANHIHFAFSDDYGDLFRSQDAKLTGSRMGSDCVVTGLLEQVSLGAPPDDARMLVAYRPASSGPLLSMDARIGRFNLTCKEHAPCK